MGFLQGLAQARYEKSTKNLVEARDVVDIYRAQGQCTENRWMLNLVSGIHDAFIESGR